MTKEQLEKEAEEYVRVTCDDSLNSFRGQELTQAYLAGAEFGFQKGIKAKINTTTISDCPIKDEWHYVKDGKYPTHSYRVLVFTDEGLGFGIYGLDDKKWHTYDTGFDVIAWKEIEPPELKEIE